MPFQDVHRHEPGYDHGGGFLVPVKYVNELQHIPGYEGVAYPDRVISFPCETRVVNLPALDQTVQPDAATGKSASTVALALPGQPKVSPRVPILSRRSSRSP